MSKITYKINRLTNPDLQLGLKTNAVLTGSATKITSTKLLEYASDLTSSIVSDNQLTNKKYVDTQLSSSSSSLVTLITKLVKSGDRINVTTSSASGEPETTVALGTAYQDGNGATFKGDEKTVIKSIVVDKYGTVTGVETTKISTADLEGNDFDNYKKWQLQVGTATADITSAWRSATDSSAVSPLVFSGSSGIGISLSTTGNPTVGISANVADPLVIKDNKITLTSILSTAASLNLYKIAVDVYGRVTSTTAITDVTGLVKLHTSAQNGLVNYKTSSNITSPSTSTYFYTSDGKWAAIDYEKVALATKTDNVEYSLLGAASSSATTSAIKVGSVTVNASTGTISAVKFSGNGSLLSSLNASNISSGTINISRLPTITADKGGVGTLSSTGSVLYTGSGNHIAEAVNPSDSPSIATDYVLTKRLSANTGLGTTTPTWVDIKDLVRNIVAGDGGMSFKGTIGTNGSAGTALPVSGFTKGDFYKVVTAGTYAGFACEVGDTFYAIANYDSSYDSTSFENSSSYWTVLQGNIENNVILDKTTHSTGILTLKTAGAFSVFDAVGLTATNSGSAWTISSSVSGNAGTATKLAASKTLWGQTFDGSANVSGNISSTGNITPAENGASSIGSSSLKYASAYINTITGNLSGKATEAGKVTNALTIGGKSYNGSAAVSIGLGATDLGFVPSVTKITSSSSGNVITDIDVVAGTDNAVTITPILGYVVDTVSSSYFNITKTNGTASIGYKTAEAKWAFYNATALPSLTDQLKFGGQIIANDLYVIDRKGKTAAYQVAQNRKSTDIIGTKEGAKLLVADTGAASSGFYGFVDSGVSIKTGTMPTTGVDTSIPTTAAVMNYVSGIKSEVTTGQLKCIKLAIAGSTVSSSHKVPLGAVIDHIDVKVNAAYNAATTLAIKCGEELIPSSELDLSTTGDVFSFKLSQEVGDESVVTGTISLTGTAGSASVYVYYAIPLN